LIKHIPLNHNILKAAISEIDRDNCLLLFPTRKSKREAQKLFQPKWDFSQQQFMTMDEWKESLFITDKPTLKEEKRTLALYLSMDVECKKFFKIRSYHQFIDFAHIFFNFWLELIEEQIKMDDISELLSVKQTAGDWQLESLHKLTEIKRNYYNYLLESKLSDALFVKDWSNFNKPNPAKIIVVNQFYFTKLEIQLLELFENRTVILTQIPEECFNVDSLLINEFKAEHIKPFMLSKLRVHTSSDQIQMIAQMSTELAKNEKAVIIDFQFEKQPYSHLLSNEYFSKNSSFDFSQTRFFRFFKVFSEILNSIIWEGKPFLISIQSILQLVSADDLLEYFARNKAEREAVRKYVFELIDNDFKFIDMEFIEIRKQVFQSLFMNIFLLAENFRKITSIKELIDFLQTDINLEYLLSDQSTRSNIAEVLYESLADFTSIEEIELVTNWKDVFPQKISDNLLKLFLDYLKPKSLKLEIESPQTRFDITTLQDTRNLEFDNLFVLNVVEGILPDRKHKQFLLSENQRKELGLKTYEDITLRDKFYFYRLLCNCRNAVAFTRSNLEENIEISSFLEELKLSGLIEESEPVDFSDLQKQLFRRLHDIEGTSISPKPKLPDNFFSFDFDKSGFTNNKLGLSFYKWEKLKNNPFEFYIEFISEIKIRNAEIGEDFSARLIGTIAHEIITLVWKRLIDVYQSPKFKHNFIYNTKLYVQQAIDYFLQHNRDLKYISPHNFSNNYFHKIFLPILADGVENFFYRLHNDLKLSDQQIEVFPETDRNEIKKFSKIADLDIYLKGRPDLRIHTKDQKYIFDFKTGSVDSGKTKRYKKQLQFYENICYLIEVPQIIEQLNSYLFFVEQEDMKQLSKRIDIKVEIEDTLKQVIESGYNLAEKKDKYEDLDITRRDLFKKELAE